MRRKDREMNREFAEAVIDKAKYGVVSILDDGSEVPYCIPLSIVRDGGVLYFHSAKEGRKVDLLSKVGKVRVVFVGEVQVPDLYSKEELDEMVQDNEKTIQLISSVFTTQFESAVVTGTITEVKDLEEKVLALRLICEKYTPEKMDYFDHAVKSGEPRTNIYRIQIETLTGKRKKYDEEGKEMKWGRM